MTTQEKSQTPTLTPKQTKYLRGLGHKLSPLVLVGKEGISEGVIEAAQTELTNHELIKVKIGSNSSVPKKDAANLIPIATTSSLVQLIGKTLLLYKANPEIPKEKRIYLPKS
jgi:RNA-binding protein